MAARERPGADGILDHLVGLDRGTLVPGIETIALRADFLERQGVLSRPGSTNAVADPKLSGPYPVWLKSIAQRTSGASPCLEVTGHTSSTGPEPLNKRRSLLRAEYVKSRLEGASPPLAKRMIVNGVGSRQTMVGNGRDDASDALNRRVEFKLIGCPG